MQVTLAAEAVISAPYSGNPPQVMPASDRLHGLVTEHSRVVWRFLRRLGLGEADADDALQEVMLVAARRLDDIRFGSERPFLLSTAYRIASSVRSVRGRRQEVSDDVLLEMSDPTPHPDSLADQLRARQLLDQVLASMPLERRAVLVAAEFEGLSLTEIAETLGIPRGTAASRLRAARDDFKSHVSRLQTRLHSQRGRA